MPKFIHLRLKDPKTGAITPHGGMTIAYEVATVQGGYKAPGSDAAQKGDMPVIVFAASQCDASDHFRKKKGRDCAAGRLRSVVFRRMAMTADPHEFYEGVLDLWKHRHGKRAFIPTR